MDKLLLAGVVGAVLLTIPFVANGHESHYDMRDDLEPERMTIAMWDFSWLYGHHPGGPFEDWAKSLDELKERRFNTVRIDAFPLIISTLEAEGKETYLHPADPLANWGQSTVDCEHNVKKELVEFIRLAKEKGVYVILSSWGQGDKSAFSERAVFWQAWELVLDTLKENDLLDPIVYVDFDQEYPYFSPTSPRLNELGKEDDSKNDSIPGFQWKPNQMAFVKDYFESTLKHFQKKYPSLRFTFSLTSYWKEVRSLGIEHFDVLELHCWLDQGRWGVRTDFGSMTKNRDRTIDHREYMQDIRDTLKAIRPMLLKNMHNQLQYAHEWSEEIAAPLVTTEAFGPWWHMDHPDLEWQWLYDWCEQCMALSSDYGFWGSTPWNYSHPYWENWSNTEWYQRVNGNFLGK